MRWTRSCGASTTVLTLVVGCGPADEATSGGTNATETDATSAATGASATTDDSASGPMTAVTDSADSGTSSASADDTGSTSSPDPTTGSMPTSDTGNGVCDAPPAPPGGDCPGECDNCTAAGVCQINCGAPECEETTIECPPNFDCEIICDGGDACDGSTIVCPPGFGCAVTCQGGSDACGDIEMQCGDGPCTIDCESEACSGATVECGAGACSATCAGMPTPTVNCGGACDCTPC